MSPIERMPVGHRRAGFWGVAFLDALVSGHPAGPRLATKAKFRDTIMQ